MRTFDYMYSYVTSRGIYDYMQRMLPENTFFWVIICLLIIYMIFSRK